IDDVAAMLADHRRQAPQAARLVADGDIDAADMGAGPVALAGPGDVEPALRRLGEIGERVTIDRMDGDALAGGDDADDAIARQRMAAAGEMQRHAGNEAADRNRVLQRLLAARR